MTLEEKCKTCAYNDECRECENGDAEILRNKGKWTCTGYLFYAFKELKK